LPCALVFQLGTKPRWQAFLVPASIAALLIGWIAVFLFSNLPPQYYLETSYWRLTMIPTFSAIVYCADALIDWSAVELATTRHIGHSGGHLRLFLQGSNAPIDRHHITLREPFSSPTECSGRDCFEPEI